MASDTVIHAANGDSRDEEVAAPDFAVDASRVHGKARLTLLTRVP